MTSEKSMCLVCEQPDDVVPLIPFYYRGQQYWICPQHLPVLIHKPASLARQLPGLENMAPAEH